MVQQDELLLRNGMRVKLFGEPIQVKAEIAQLPGSSGHADKDGLIHWVNAIYQ